MKDSALFTRLLSYLRPYWKIATLALVSLIIATVAELFIPVLLQSAIDEDLYPQYDALTVPSERNAEDILRKIENAGRTSQQKMYNLGSHILIPRKDVELLAGWGDFSLAPDLSDGDQILRQVIPITLSEETEEIIELYGLQTIGTVSDNRGILLEALESLPEEAVTLLRRQDHINLRSKVFLLLGLLVINLLFTFGQVYFTAKSGQYVMKDLRIQLFSHVTKQRLGALQTIPVGTLVSRVTNDVETINELFTSVLTSLLKDISLMVGVVTTLLLMDRELGLITIATLPPVLVLTLLFRRKARSAYRNVRHWVSEVTRFLSEHIAGMSVIHAFVQEQWARSIFNKKNNSLLGANLSEMYVFSVFRPSVDFLSTLSTGASIFFGALLFLNGMVSLGILVAFVNLVGRFYQPVMDMSEKFTILQSALSGGERVFSFLDQKDEIQDSGTPINPSGIAGAIRFENVCFSYKPDEPVLKNLSFSVSPGQRIAVVGHTGAGKTTIANLMTRMWDIDSGTIWLDGVPLQNYQLSSLRRAIQPIQQDISLFNDTIRNNLLLGNTVDDATLWNILETVQAKDFIERLPHGLDTVLSEGATNLSTGQRQLLAFGRILVQDPRVIILDEATANIDSETELRIQQALNSLLQNRTSILIAHRLSTIKDADHILVLAKGSIAEEGTHESLLNQKGLYSNLYKLQFKE
ncbi:ABC transporter ATP-binding protein [Spirochaeta lutea]|uniref:ABC transporter ATP-binding protein n=1 Tax=Spirochaeta lutea TaxID=1480694 RepID=A0A098R0V5_9SPIO|nr:ABC transporter ATP-binding protein [Spirochaeta lutea]KGE73629.1 hypothetical protein DC28_03040 [Spirochaeta lutea]